MRVLPLMTYTLSAGFGLAELLTPTPAVSDPTITAAPEVPMELFRKQNNDRFMGWLSISGSYTSRTCDVGGTYYQSGSNWRCCATTLASCNVPLGCFSGSLIYRVTTSGTQTSTLRTIPCISAYDPTDSTFSVCNTGFLYENTGVQDALTNIFCGVSSVNWSYYRVRPQVTSSSSSRSSSTPSSSTPTSTPASISDTIAFPTPTTSPNPQPSEKSSSKAWIAGAVVGPVVGLALLAAIIFFFMRRKKKTTPAQPLMTQQSGPNGMAPSYPGSPNQSHQSAYYSQQKQDTAPFGVASQGSWVPQSPTTQGSVTPHPPQSPYTPPPQQQWQPIPQQGQQTYPPPMTGSPPSQMQQNVQTYKHTGVSERPFSAELEGGGYQNVGGVVAPPSQQK